MEVLEIKPVKNKKVKIFLLRNEIGRFNEEKYKNLRKILEKEKFRFAIIDFNNKEIKKTYERPLLEFLNNCMIPYFSVEIPEYVKNYLDLGIFDKEILLNELEEEYEELCLNDEEMNSFKILSLKNWIEILKQEIELMKKNLKMFIHPQWIVKKVLDIVKKIENNVFSIIHFTHKEIYNELTNLFEIYNIKVIKYDISNKNIKQILIKKEVKK